MPFAWTYQLQIDGKAYRGHPAELRQLETGAKLRFTTSQLATGYRLCLVLEAAQAVRIDHCYLETDWQFHPNDWVLANGFQSWTESRWYHPGDQIPPLRRIARPLMGHYGDYHLPWIDRGPGRIHSWSWTEWRRHGQAPLLLASLNERQAFTCFQWSAKDAHLRIEADCRAHHLQGEMVLLDVLVLSGELPNSYDTWTELLELAPPRAPLATGWTSWYQHYTHISAAIIADNLRQLVAQSSSHTFFQVDDGYQQAVGDWCSVKATFPQGMSAVAANIRAQGLLPGLWLAPTVTGKGSQLLREHPDWLQRDGRGRPLRAGYNPLWGGWYYALDTTHPGWQAYTQEVLRTVTDDWGFALLKLDFLFTACLYPQRTRTRAQLMYGCLRQLREWAGEAYLLGCGTPLASGFGLFDYCRVGADIHLAWEHPLLRWFRHRERVSTAVALRTVLARAPLAGRVWRSDPDVYLLRDKNIKLSRAERALVHRVNALVGELLFTSDNVGDYGPWQRSEWAKQAGWRGRQVEGVTPLGEDRYALQTDSGRIIVDLGQRQIIEP